MALTAALVIAFSLAILLILHQISPYKNTPSQGDHFQAWMTTSASLMFVVLALLLALFTKVHPLETLALTPKALVQGLLALAPLLVFLFFTEKSAHPRIHKFRDQQIELFSKIGFRFTPLRILMMSIGAGVGEEMLFRGALQGWLSGFLPIIMAIILPAILFGLLHNANRTYMVIAALVGIYLGISFVVTDNIAVPIIAHLLYDVIAIHRTAILIERSRASIAENSATTL